MSRAALDSIALGLEMALAGIRKLREEPDPEEWVGQDVSPLGRRRHCELARDGLLEGAVKRDGKWYVRRRVVDAYIEAGARPEAKVNEADETAAILSYRAPERRRRTA